MADTIQLKRRTTDNAAPTALADGELALNAFDMTLYGKDKDNVIKKLNDSYTKADTYTKTEINAKLDLTNWSVKEESNVLFFLHSGVKKAKLDSSGNFTVVGNLTGYGTM